MFRALIGCAGPGVGAVCALPGLPSSDWLWAKRKVAWSLGPWIQDSGRPKGRKNEVRSRDCLNLAWSGCVQVSLPFPPPLGNDPHTWWRTETATENLDVPPDAQLRLPGLSQHHQAQRVENCPGKQRPRMRRCSLRLVLETLFLRPPCFLACIMGIDLKLSTEMTKVGQLKLLVLQRGPY